MQFNNIDASIYQQDTTARLIPILTHLLQGCNAQIGNSMILLYHSGNTMIY